MLRLNSSTNKGLLYRFVGRIKTLEDILDNGIKPSSYGEYDWEMSSKIKREDDGTARFAAFTRNPSAIIQARHKGWRYAVIIDSSKLTDKYLLRPYSYHYRPGLRGIEIWIMGSEIKAKKMGAGVCPLIDYSYDDMEAAMAWAEEKEKTKQARMEIIDFQGEALENGEELSKESPDMKVLISFNLGTDERYVDKDTLHDESYYPDKDYYERAIKPKNLKTIPPQELPHCLTKVISSAWTESEERLYTKKAGSQERVKLGDSLVGVLLPDSYITTDDFLDFINNWYDVPWYIYKDITAKDNKKVQDRLKEIFEEHPEYKQRYRLPQ